MPVFFHECTTSGAVHDDELIAVAERLNVRPCQASRFVEQSGVRVQRAAAPLPWHVADLVAVHD
jgi:hypothetical protein